MTDTRRKLNWNDLPEKEREQIERAFVEFPLAESLDVTLLGGRVIRCYRNGETRAPGRGKA